MTQEIKKTLHVFAWIAIIGNICLIILIGFWKLWPYQIPYVKQPIEIMNENKEIRIGEVIRMKLYVSKPKYLVSNSLPTITCSDGNLVTLAPSSLTLPRGEYVYESETYVLPPKVAVGAECQFNFNNYYQLNPVRNEPVTWSSEQFKVLPKEK